MLVNATKAYILSTLHSLVTADLGIAITNCILFSIHSFVVLRIERLRVSSVYLGGAVCCLLSLQGRARQLTQKSV